jgi:3-dehydroquinate dehydratase
MKQAAGLTASYHSATYTAAMEHITEHVDDMLVSFQCKVCCDSSNPGQALQLLACLRFVMHYFGAIPAVCL